MSYDDDMARGWESKAVEAQVEDKARDKAVAGASRVTPEERARLQRRQSLELARARTAADLARPLAPAHRRMLEEALKALDSELAAS